MYFCRRDSNSNQNKVPENYLFIFGGPCHHSSFKVNIMKLCFPFKRSYCAFWVSACPFITLCSISVHVKVKKILSPCQRELPSPTENTAPAVWNTWFEVKPLLLWCASLCNRCYINIHFYTFIIKYIHSSQRQIYSCYCWSSYFRSHYLARHDPPYSASDWLHPSC